MAQVHLAVARGLGGFNKLVVLKRLESSDDAFRAMFLDEARLAALLQHPNVVHTYEVSEAGGSYLIAMEYLDGQPLDKVVREALKLGQPLEARLCVRIVADALSGLHYTHELKDYEGAPLHIVHRDISPHNLFVTYTGAVKVLDFGVARTAIKTSQTEAGVLKGKLAYMAPEQAAAQPVDRRADVFAIGAVLWELLTLQRLRRADSAQGLLSEAIQGQLPNLQELRPDVSRELEGVLWRALAHYPHRRYPTAHAMREALLEYLATDPCSQEDVASFMLQRFGELHDKMQRQISECIKQVEQQAPVIAVSEEPTPLQLLLTEAAERSLPLLDSGSLPLRHDDATTPLLPGALLPPSEPPPPAEPGHLARSRAITFGDDPATEKTSLRWIVLGASLAFVGLLLLWARRPTAEAPPPASAKQRGSAASGRTVLRVHGSNTIGQELAPRLAEAFLRQLGYGEVQRASQHEGSTVSGRPPGEADARTIEIVAHGSTTAFSDLASGACDVGMSSRRIKTSEAQLLRERGLGDLESAAGEHVLGLDGIAVIVHPNSPLERVDLVTLRRIFTGELSDYAALGGASGKVNLYSRDDRSGTFDTFKHLVLGDQAVAAQAARLSDSAELSNAVARDPQGIGFIGIPYVRGARAVSVGTRGGAFMHPSTFTVATEGYELSRRLYLYLPVQGPSSLAVDFVSFALSSAGQEVVRASGFVDLTLRATATGSCEGCPARYAELAQKGKRLSLDFRFRTGSSELDNRGLRDLDRVLAFLRENSQARLVLVGFSDARGGSTQNLKLSQERAKKLAEQLRERGVGAVDVEAMGSELPVASNDTESGREKNRRVEVWLR